MHQQMPTKSPFIRHTVQNVSSLFDTLLAEKKIKRSRGINVTMTPDLTSIPAIYHLTSIMYVTTISQKALFVYFVTNRWPGSLINDS